MKRRVPGAVAGVLVASIALVASASAGDTSVDVTDNKFTPEKLTIEVGDNASWIGSTGNQHNVKQDDRLFRSGDPTTNLNHILLNVSAGTYPYYCQVHGGKGGRGMSGALRVRPTFGSMKSAPGKRGVEFPIIWAASSGTGDRFDVRYKVSGRKGFKTWLKNTTDEFGDFGEDNDPVKVRPGKTYSIQARTEVAGTDKASDWSPSLKVGALP